MVNVQELKQILNSTPNGSDGAYNFGKNGVFISTTHWKTMKKKMKNASSAQAVNDRMFYDKSLPQKKLDILVRFTTREVIKDEEEGKVLLHSFDVWKHADGLVKFDNGFKKICATAKGKNMMKSGKELVGGPKANNKKVKKASKATKK